MRVEVIVSRHPATVAFLTRLYPEAVVTEQATADDVRGKHVAGNLPLHLAALAASITAAEFPALSRDERGKELAGEPTLTTYIVRLADGDQAQCCRPGRNFPISRTSAAKIARVCDCDECEQTIAALAEHGLRIADLPRADWAPGVYYHGPVETLASFSAAQPATAMILFADRRIMPKEVTI